MRYLDESSIINILEFNDRKYLEINEVLTEGVGGIIGIIGIIGVVISAFIGLMRKLFDSNGGSGGGGKTSSSYNKSSYNNNIEKKQTQQKEIEQRQQEKEIEEEQRRQERIEKEVKEKQKQQKEIEQRRKEKEIEEEQRRQERIEKEVEKEKMIRKCTINYETNKSLELLGEKIISVELLSVNRTDITRQLNYTNNLIDRVITMSRKYISDIRQLITEFKDIKNDYYRSVQFKKELDDKIINIKNNINRYFDTNKLAAELGNIFPNMIKKGTKDDRPDLQELENDRFFIKSMEDIAGHKIDVFDNVDLPLSINLINRDIKVSDSIDILNAYTDIIDKMKKKLDKLNVIKKDCDTLNNKFKHVFRDDIKINITSYNDKENGYLFKNDQEFNDITKIPYELGIQLRNTVSFFNRRLDFTYHTFRCIYLAYNRSCFNLESAQRKIISDNKNRVIPYNELPQEFIKKYGIKKELLEESVTFFDTISLI